MQSVVIFAIVVASIVFVSTIAALASVYSRERRKFNHLAEDNSQHGERAQFRLNTSRLDWPEYTFVEAIGSSGDAEFDTIQPGDQFGALGLDKTGHILAVGAPGHNGVDIPKIGALYVSTCGKEKCEQVFMVTGEEASEQFGAYVLVRGSRVFVLSTQKLYIYTSIAECSAQWKLQYSKQLSQSGSASGEFFLDANDGGDTLMVAGQGSDEHCQLHVMTYTPATESWHTVFEKRKIKSEVTALACCPNGQEFVVCYHQKNISHADIFALHDGAFTHMQQVTLPALGAAITFHLNHFIIGCPHLKDLRGGFVIFRQYSTSKENIDEKNTLKSITGEHTTYKKSITYQLHEALPGHEFGYVKLSPNGLVLAVAAPGEGCETTDDQDQIVTVYGAIYIFRRTTTEEDFVLCQKLVYPGHAQNRWAMFGSQIEFSHNGKVMFASAQGAMDGHLAAVGKVFKFQELH